MVNFLYFILRFFLGGVWYNFFRMRIIFIIAMFLLGAAMGSFLCCQARRLKRKKMPARSICLKCKKQLRWFENLPILSWIFLRGRCRYCRAKIGVTEVLAEIFGGAIFAGLAMRADFWSGNATGFSGPIFVMTVVLVLSLGFLSLCDIFYQELPSLWLTFSIICGIIVAILKIWSSILIGGDFWASLGDLAGCVVILAGTYLFLYLFSKGKWVGDGDWLICLAIALAVGEAFWGLVILCVANLAGTLVMLPILRRQKKRKVLEAKIPFGPFLVLGFVVVLLCF